MMIYWYEIIYQSRVNSLRVSRYLAKIYCRLPNYANNLYYKAIEQFCADRNAEDMTGEYEIQSIKFLKAVAYEEQG
jgi:hypothetical protein